MTLSGIIIAIVIMLIIYYIGMIAWDQYQFSLEDKASAEIQEDEIDITSDLEGTDCQPIIVEVTKDSHKLKIGKKRIKKFPFPWTAEQIHNAFAKLKDNQESDELDNVVFFEEQQYKAAI